MTVIHVTKELDLLPPRPQVCGLRCCFQLCCTAGGQSQDGAEGGDDNHNDETNEWERRRRSSDTLAIHHHQQHRDQRTHALSNHHSKPTQQQQHHHHPFLDEASHFVLQLAQLFLSLFLLDMAWSRKGTAQQQAEQSQPLRLEGGKDEATANEEKEEGDQNLSADDPLAQSPHPSSTSYQPATTG